MKNLKKIILVLFLMGILSCINENIPFKPQPDIIIVQDSEFVVINPLLIDDFEDGNFKDKLNGRWSALDDNGFPGDSTCSTSIVKVTSDFNNVIHLEYTLGPLYEYRYVMLELAYTIDNARDFKQEYNGIVFWMRGSGHKVRVVLRSDEVGGSNYDDYGYVINKTDSIWKMYTIPFEELKQEGWGGILDKDAVLKKINHIQFKTDSKVIGEKGWFEIDNIAVVKLIEKK